jgi:hypothetical protein
MDLLGVLKCFNGKTPFFIKSKDRGYPLDLDVSEYVMGGIMYPFFLDHGFLLSGGKVLEKLAESDDMNQFMGNNIESKGE